MRFHLETSHPVAFESPDHQMPWGTKRDNSKAPRFSRKLMRLFAATPEPLYVLDLGCSGGGFVRDCLERGCRAMGLEGSDYSLKRKRAEWAVIPENLFTGDITKPFKITWESNGTRTPAKFHAITMWEVMEHIAEGDLPALAENIRQVMADSGLWIVSVSPDEEWINGVRLHQTVQPKEWWIEKMRRLGFFHNEGYVEYFNGHFVRGPKYGAGASFHLIMATHPDLAPNIPKLALRERIMDAWVASQAQRGLRKLVLGDE